MSTNFDFLLIANYKFSVIPAKSFDGLRILFISVKSNTPFETALLNESFVGLTDLRQLMIVGMNVGASEPDALEPIHESLTGIVIEECTQATVDYFMLDPHYEFTNLKRFQLFGTRVNVLRPEWFTRFCELKNFSILECANFYFGGRVQ